MSKEEMMNLLGEAWDNNFAPILRVLDNKIEGIRDEIKKEHEELKTRAITAETKLKFYESLFNKLNLNMEVENDNGQR